MMTSAQVVETSVTTTDNSPSQDYTHLDDQTYTFTCYLRVQTIFYISSSTHLDRFIFSSR